MLTRRHFLKISDLTLDEARAVFRLAAEMKAEPKGMRLSALAGKAVAIVMEKPSTRTRISFEAGVAALGAQPIVVTTEGSQLARGEPIKDTARVLSRYVDAIVYRTFGHSRLLEMAEHASVPVVNALTDDGHPVQVLCDVFTMEEAWAARGDNRSIAGRRVAFVGDCSSNMARSFVEAAQLFHFHLALAAPSGYFPPEAESAAAIAGDRLSLHATGAAASVGADAVHTDVWTSMGQEKEQIARRTAFAGWTVDEAMIAQASPGALVMHCLPAHRGEEISDAAIEGPQSVVWSQAENRLHVQKALLAKLMLGF